MPTLAAPEFTLQAAAPKDAIQPEVPLRDWIKLLHVAVHLSLVVYLMLLDHAGGRDRAAGLAFLVWHWKAGKSRL